MFMELYKFSRLVVHLNSCSMDLGRDIQHIVLTVLCSVLSFYTCVLD